MEGKEQPNQTMNLIKQKQATQPGERLILLMSRNAHSENQADVHGNTYDTYEWQKKVNTARVIALINKNLFSE